MPSFESMRAGYRAMWSRVSIKPEKRAEAESTARKIIAAKARYQAIEKATGVPWIFIALTHMRESSLNFSTYLGNGQPLNRKTTIVPKGRGPWASFEAGAIDALMLLNLDEIKAWPFERVAYELERWNGWGYLGKINSPYLWAGSTLEQRGKYVADGKFDPNAMDQQLGCMTVLFMLADLDADAAALTGAEKPQDAPPPPPAPLSPPTPKNEPAPKPAVPAPAPKQSFTATLVAALLRVFGRK